MKTMDGRRSPLVWLIWTVVSVFSLFGDRAYHAALADQGSTKFATALDIIQADEDLQSFVKAINETGFSDNLQHNDWLTVFAPTEIAFERFRFEPEAKYLLPSWKMHLQIIMGLHLEAATNVSIYSADNETISTYFGETIVVNSSDDGYVTVASAVNAANVVGIDPVASNGVLYRISNILLPWSLTFDAFTLLDFSDFSIMAQMLISADLEGTIRTKDLTLLVPIDSAFQALPAATLEYLQDPANVDTLSEVLLDHVIWGPLIWPSFELEASPVLETAGGHTLPVNSTGPYSFTFGDIAQAILLDGIASNGVIHGLDTVLLLTNLSFSDPPSDAPSNAPSDMSSTSSFKMY